MKILSLLLLLGAAIHINSQVGINTQQPTETLDVNGSARIRNIRQTGPNASVKDSIVVFDNGGVLKRTTASQIVTEGKALTSVVTAAPIAGNGTVSNPIILGQSGATNGQLLQWNGTAWVPVSPSSLGTISLNLGTSGNNINISNSPVSLGGSMTLNVPDASATARGVVTTTDQSFSGTKMFSAVGINTSSPNASSRLDVNGAFKLGTTGTVNKNVINFSASVNNSISNGDTTFLTGAFNSSGILDVNVTIPAANRPTSTQAIVSVSPNFDLPGAVSIASARLTSPSNVRIRFINTDRNNSQTISGTLFITISEF